MWGVGTRVRIADPLWLAGEMFGEFTPSGHEERDGSSSVLAPIEWLGGVQWRPDRRFMVSLAAGRGLTSAAGAPALRGVFALTITPYASELKPLHPPPPEDVTDTDGDGVLDRIDRCDKEPEDKDLFEDDDGCPDLDNDKDGIADAQDKCPLDAEDKDGFQDDDGCVDKDNDSDNIADAQDKCPMDAEDNDGFQDADGCPDPDNDGDGVADANDKCPGQKETINGNQDNDGCPDQGISLVLVTLDRFDLMESIQFSGERIKSSSYNLLGQIAATLRARPDVLRIRIAVHVSAGRDEAKDQQLSERRAAALREWLVQWGIEAKRLDVRGFGSSKPLGGSAAANERVEIVIMDKK
jgi:outer membrane protein OmpA-like peptidoglycan-associated protein